MNIKYLFGQFFDLLNNKFFWVSLFDVLFLTVPGILWLYKFDREALFGLETTKLVLLSVAITSPLVFINSLAMSSWRDNIKKDIFYIFTLGIMMTSLVFGISILLYYLNNSFNKQLISFPVFILILIAIDFFGLFVDYSEEKKLHKKSFKA